MTMPSKIDLYRVNSPGSLYDGAILQHTEGVKSAPPSPYIRAEIAEELARALREVEEVMRMLEGKPVARMTEAEKAIKMLDRSPLARYNAAITSPITPRENA